MVCQRSCAGRCGRAPGVDVVFHWHWYTAKNRITWRRRVIEGFGRGKHLVLSNVDNCPQVVRDLEAFEHCAQVLLMAYYPICKVATCLNNCPIPRINTHR